MKPIEQLEALYREEVELWRHRDPRGGTPLPSTEAALRLRATWRFFDHFTELVKRIEALEAGAAPVLAIEPRPRPPAMRRELMVHEHHPDYIFPLERLATEEDLRALGYVIQPLPLLLTCPECRARHIDVGEFATKPHHTHACQHCGHCWRPALVATVGVQFLPGFKNAEAAEGVAAQ